MRLQGQVPLVRAIFPNLIATDIVSVQPMTGPSSLIFYLQFVYGSDKGRTKAGTAMFDNPDKNYGGELIEGETVGTGDTGGGGDSTPTLSNLSYKKVRKGSLILTAIEKTTGAELRLIDNSAGGLISPAGTAGAAGSVNYDTGALGATTPVDFGTGIVIEPSSIISATYEWDSEGSSDIPQVDLLLTSTPVVARPKKLRSRHSMEAAANLRLVHGIDAEMELSSVLAEELNVWAPCTVMCMN